MATSRNAETPPNFVSKTLQNRAQKVPNVPSETLEKQYRFGQGFIVFFFLRQGFIVFDNFFYFIPLFVK